jgi:hypothetical protein
VHGRVDVLTAKVGDTSGPDIKEDLRVELVTALIPTSEVFPSQVLLHRRRLRFG